MAYWRVEPFGDDWRRSARTSLVMAGGKLDPEAEGKFLPSYRSRQMTEAEQVAELMTIPAFAAQLKAQGY